MTWVKDVFLNHPNDTMDREQLLYQLRDAQNATLEIGNLLSQSAKSGPAPEQVVHLEQLNARVGGFLQRLRQRIDRETQ